MEQIVNSQLYDTTIGYDTEPTIKVASFLSEHQVELAKKLYRVFNELWGVCIVKGKVGAGKDLFGNIISYMIKTYFPWKRVLRDEKPRELYGDYAGLFSDKVLVNELAKMKAVALDGKPTKGQISNTLDNMADNWVTTKGEVMLKNSVLYLTEYWRYCYCREPHAPMNKTMGAIHKMKRHLDTLIIGTIQLVSDLDKRTTKPFIDWQVTCTKDAINPTGFVYYIEQVSYDSTRDIIEPVSRPYPMAFDAGKPRTDLGDGTIKVVRSDYVPNRREQKIIDAVKSGAETYEDLLKSLRLSEDIILSTLKDLKFNKAKRAIDYPCFFGLYNSKSAPQIKSTLRVEE